MRKLANVLIATLILLLTGCSDEPPNRSFEYFSKKDQEYTYKFSDIVESISKKNKSKVNFVSVIGSLPKYSPVIDPYQIGSFGMFTKSSDDDIDGNFHTGTDLISLSGNRSVYATGNGIVAVKETDPKLGNVVLVRHTNGVEVLYTHLENAYVNLADKVHPNTLIGQYGVSGSATQAHLHYEVLVGGYPVDPIKSTQISTDYQENQTKNSWKAYKAIQSIKDRMASSIEYRANIRRPNNSIGNINVSVVYKDEKIAIKMVKFYGDASKEEEILNDCKVFDRDNWKCKYLNMTDGHLFLEEPFEKSIIYFTKVH